MQIFLSATMYPRSREGWQGVFIGHMAHALARHEEVDLSICAPPGELPPGTRSTPTQQESNWLGALVDRGGISHALRERRLSSIFSALRLLYILRRNYRAAKNVDVYHVNWMQSAIPLPNNRIPALVTVLGNDLNLLKVPLMKTVMRRVLASRPSVLCPNAEWMRAPLEEAFGDITRVHPVPFGIDPLWYDIKRSPQPARAPRRWLVISRLTRAKMGPLFNWSENLFRDGSRELHLLGPLEEQIEVPSWVHYHGPASPADLATKWFPNATGLITLSHHAEGRPQVMMEAMAAGLPIVASRMPAHEDLVGDQVTGVLCDDQEGYEDAVRSLEAPDINLRMGQAARNRVLDVIGTWDDCADRYVHLYHELMDDIG